MKDPFKDLGSCRQDADRSIIFFIQRIFLFKNWDNLSLFEFVWKSAFRYTKMYEVSQRFTLRV